jgi:hypothetical protein
LVVTQEQFYPLLYADIGRATKRVVFYSPFLTLARIEALRVHLRAAVERAVKVYIVTKPPHERSKYRRIHRHCPVKVNAAQK